MVSLKTKEFISKHISCFSVDMYPDL